MPRAVPRSRDAHDTRDVGPAPTRAGIDFTAVNEALARGDNAEAERTAEEILQAVAPPPPEMVALLGRRINAALGAPTVTPRPTPPPRPREHKSPALARLLRDGSVTVADHAEKNRVIDEWYAREAAKRLTRDERARAFASPGICSSSHSRSRERAPARSRPKGRARSRPGAQARDGPSEDSDDPPRLCEECDGPLGDGRRSSARYCKPACKQAAYRRSRRADAPPLAPLPPDVQEKWQRRAEAGFRAVQAGADPHWVLAALLAPTLGAVPPAPDRRTVLA